MVDNLSGSAEFNVGPIHIKIAKASGQLDEQLVMLHSRREHYLHEIIRIDQEIEKLEAKREKE